MATRIGKEIALTGHSSKQVSSKHFDKKGVRRNKISKRSIGKNLTKLRMLKKSDPARIAIKKAQAQVN